MGYWEKFLIKVLSELQQGWEKKNWLYGDIIRKYFLNSKNSFIKYNPEKSLAQPITLRMVQMESTEEE